MVEIREENSAAGNSSESNAQQRPSSSTNSSSNNGPGQEYTATGGGSSSMMDHLKSKPVDSILWSLRFLTIMFGLLYAIPLMGPESQVSAFSKTLIASAATNGLRLYQRMGGIRFDREYLAGIFLEDSCHYLFYSVIFMSSYPVTMPLMPVFLFALLHWSSYTIQVLRAGNQMNNVMYRLVSRLVNEYSQTLLSVIACTEIFLMPMTIVLIFMGKGNLLFPFIYYRFLSLRYMSRRNPNTRQAFFQMRMALEQSVNRPNCPPIIRNAAEKSIALISRLAPQVPVA